MTAALTPDLALAYLRELSADYLGGVVLDAEGALLAGDEGLAPLARDVEGDGATTHGKVFFASDTRHAIVVVTGPRALPSPVRRDIRAALSALGSQSAQG